MKNVNNKNYEVLLFDMDNTLINFRETKKLTYIDMCKILNRTYSELEYYIYYHWENEFFKSIATNTLKIPEKYKTAEDIQSYIVYRWFNGIWGNTFEETNDIYKLYLDCMKNNIIPIPDVEETIKYLSQKYKLVIASNGDIELIETKLKASKIYPYFSNIIVAGFNTKHFKPNALFFEDVMNIINFYDRSKIVMIGDCYVSDIQGAINSGITPIWFNFQNEPTHYYNFDKEKIIYKITELTKLI